MSSHLNISLKITKIGRRWRNVEEKSLAVRKENIYLLGVDWC